MDKISLIIPCYNEEETIPILYNELNRISHLMKYVTFELFFIDDGSTDNTLLYFKELSAKDSRVKYISFSRNFGKESAMYAGLSHANGDYVAILDADMQDPPDLLPKLYSTIKEGKYNSVATRRTTREGEPRFRTICAKIFYKIMRKISKTNIVDGSRDFRLMDRKFVNSILSLKEFNRFTKGMYNWVGFKTTCIEYENVKRCAGKTKWSFLGLLTYSLEGIISYSTVPLIITSLIGLFFFVLSLFFIIFIIIRQLIYHNSANGWSSSICIILLIGGIQLFSIGIIGQYLSQIYLEIKGRPHYIIDETNINENYFDL
ncbi:glycosyltransferase family 2 protein [Lachnobacterium bovis]|uniref:glycosyltransferase family 2 protein n=1 Tax=Lachnobacterium bovis TaxID=140626 RepID=UPI00047F20E5|nr:glycosyltransferase family 2 protein [Lachnobacterium bovis]